MFGGSNRGGSSLGGSVGGQQFMSALTQRINTSGLRVPQQVAGGVPSVGGAFSAPSRGATKYAGQKRSAGVLTNGGSGFGAPPQSARASIGDGNVAAGRATLAEGMSALSSMPADAQRMGANGVTNGINFATNMAGSADTPDGTFSGFPGNPGLGVRNLGEYGDTRRRFEISQRSPEDLANLLKPPVTSIQMTTIGFPTNHVVPGVYHARCMDVGYASTVPKIGEALFMALSMPTASSASRAENTANPPRDSRISQLLNPSFRTATMEPSLRLIYTTWTATMLNYYFASNAAFLSSLAPLDLVERVLKFSGVMNTDNGGLNTEMSTARYKSTPDLFINQSLYGSTYVNNYWEACCPSPRPGCGLYFELRKESTIEVAKRMPRALTELRLNEASFRQGNKVVFRIQGRFVVVDCKVSEIFQLEPRVFYTQYDYLAARKQHPESAFIHVGRMMYSQTAVQCASLSSPMMDTTEAMAVGTLAILCANGAQW